METLEQFIQTNRDPRELKRALAVQMSQRGHSYREIRDVLQVSVGFVTACNQRYEAAAVEGLRSNYWGTQGYLAAQQKQELFNWLAPKDTWTIEELSDHLEEKYQVVYQSQQSYYTLLKPARFSWKKSQPPHPDKDQAQVAEKKPEIMELLVKWRAEVARGQVRVMFDGECHLRWGDLSGYGWSWRFSPGGCTCQIDPGTANLLWCFGLSDEAFCGSSV